MTVDAIVRMRLPDLPYAMWVRGELADYLRLPKDGMRVEVVGGEVIVSPGPTFDHDMIVTDIQRGLFAAEIAQPDYRWRCVQTQDFNLVAIGDGCIPDLIVLDQEIAIREAAARAQFLHPHQVQLVVEVTSPSNASNDRAPVVGRRQRATRWSGYARTGVPWYLLVDRDPRSRTITLYNDPDTGLGEYRVHSSWKFGEPVLIPAPLNFSFSTELWQPWKD